MADTPDPYDIEALGEAVNDSASRVSTIWISFLIFSLYMLVAAGTVTQRQLFLDDPTKLPVLNIDLPLWWFFLLAPILFVVFHVYVLLQVLLLGRTAAAYNAAVISIGLSPDENISLRQRLANTIFAQIFAGSPRERDGFVGSLLKGVAWITLAFAPILILLAFQFRFLPYHSETVTLTHRSLILTELMAFFVIWPLALDARHDFRWPSIRDELKHLAALPQQLAGSTNQRSTARLWLWHRAGLFSACFLYIVICFSIASFPGEPHVNILTGHTWSSVQCDRWLQQKFEYIDLRFDRLDLPHVDAVDHEKLEKIEEVTKKAGEPPYQGERTRVLRDRDLNCSDLSDYADLRRVDLSGSHLRKTDLSDAKLQGATFERAELQGANLHGAKLQGASLVDAQLQGASLVFAELQNAILRGAQLQSADLSGTSLQGADLRGAYAQGVDLSDAKLQGAFLSNARLQGANLNGAELEGALLLQANLQGANLEGARLQGAALLSAQLQGASLDRAQLPGASFGRSTKLTYASIAEAYVWRARNAACQESRVIDPKNDATIAVIPDPPRAPKLIHATPDEIANFIDDSIADIIDAGRKSSAHKRMQERLVVDPVHDDTDAIGKTWSDCAAASRGVSQQKFDDQRAELLRELVCNSSDDRKAIALGVIRNWISDSEEPPTELSIQLARGILGQNGGRCAVAEDLDQDTKNDLSEAAARTVPDASTGPAEPSSAN